MSPVRVGATASAVSVQDSSPESIETLVLDLLEWVGPGSRDYHDVLDAWRTSCPRLPVWEEATRRGLLTRHWEDGRAKVSVTALGATLLADRRPEKLPAAVRRPR